MIKVYIASPYTKGDVGVNVKRQMECFDSLVDMGFAPLAPLWTHFQHIAFPRHYDEWLKLDLEWLSVCDCVLRLPGESSGADKEVAHAVALGKPVFYSVGQLQIHYYDQLDIVP